SIISFRAWPYPDSTECTEREQPRCSHATSHLLPMWTCHAVLHVAPANTCTAQGWRNGKTRANSTCDTPFFACTSVVIGSVPCVAVGERGGRKINSSSPVAPSARRPCGAFSFGVT